MGLGMFRRLRVRDRADDNGGNATLLSLMEDGSWNVRMKILGWSLRELSLYLVYRFGGEGARKKFVRRAGMDALRDHQGNISRKVVCCSLLP